MEQLSPLWSVPAFVVVLLIGGLLQRTADRRNPPVVEAGLQPRRFARAVASIRMIALAFGAAVVVLWLSLPSTPVLSSFGYPKTVQQISEPVQMLALLQEYNRAIVRTTEVLSLFMFLVVFVLIGSTISIISGMNMTAALAHTSLPRPSGTERGGR